jgi:hypothetical protein
MISKKKLASVAAGTMVAAATAFGITSLVTGTAHAQGTSSFSIVGLVENSEGTGPAIQISFTCSSPGLEWIDVSATQGGTATGNVGYTSCTGSAQTVTINLEFGSSALIDQFGAGQVQVGVTAGYMDQSVTPHTTTYTGTTTTLTYP